MRSPNGRHRRPRQAPAIVVAAGVTGSAIAIPLLGAGSASAAESATWDRVAECETGGMWTADLSNGRYGGLQMTLQTWQQFGGTEYARSADLASRSEQIAIAEKVLAAKGPSAWADCATIAGLTTGGTAAGVDPGAAPPPAPLSSLLPTAPEEAATPADPAEPVAPVEPTGKTTPDAPAATTQESGTATGDAETGKHRGTPEQTTEPGHTDEDREGGRHASRGDAAAREGATDAGKAPEARTADVSPGVYTVRPGDTLWAIADAQDLPGGWSAVFEANRETVGDDPDLILPGQSLDLGLK